MAEHKFREGQRVTLAANIINRTSTGGGYIVVKQLPHRDGEFEYRIKNAAEPHERVARESELTHDLKDIVHDSVENGKRARGK
jgi:hypothetical protein